MPTEPTAEALSAYAELTASQYRGHVGDIVARLLNLANRIEHHCQTPSSTGPAPFNAAAATLINELHTGLANLNTYALIRSAAEADRAHEAAQDPS